MIEAIENLGILDDTLIYVHHRRQRRLRRGTLQRRVQRDGQFQRHGRAGDNRVHAVARCDEFGAPDSYNHYAVGWAHAMDTPYQWTKQVASHWGGTRNGTIVHWPKGIEEKGGMRTQFSHVIDVAPTILEAAGLPEPIAVNGVQQSPMEGTSMLYSFNDAARRPNGTSCSTSRCSATAAFTTRAGAR